jgi:acetyltransferase-like isoleucine patch superfamily enzyme
MRRLVSGGYRVVWRAVTVTILVWRARWTHAVWGGDDAAFLLTRARKHAIIPLLRALGAHVAPGAEVETHLIIHNAPRDLHALTIGEGCHVGKAAFFDLADAISLEPRCTLSMRVTLLTHIDVGRSPLRDGPYSVERGPITIGDGAYIGANATILHGVRVGRNAVVAAGAVVRENVPDFAVVGGVPARVLKQLDPSTIPGETRHESTR